MIDNAGADEPDRGQRVLLVGACVGNRCAALRRLAVERTAPDGRELIREAVRRRPDAVMVDLPCPGLCSHGAVTVVGPATSRDGRLNWVRQPTWVSSTDETQRARDIAAWIIRGAPDPRALPDSFARL